MRKISVSKIDAAKSQLNTAINLLFSEGDPVSIHTLTCASLQILHDHFGDDQSVFDNNLIIHPKTASKNIKPDYIKEFINKSRNPANFFKHAKEDLKKGANKIEFNPQSTHFFILEAIRCLNILDKSFYSPECRIFDVWFKLKNFNGLTDEEKKELSDFHEMNHENYQDFYNLICELKKASSLRESTA